MSSRRHILIVLLVIVIGYTQTLFSKTREGHPINTTLGLSNSKLNDIFLDSKGYLWLAADDGLNRHDAYEFVVFRPALSDSTSSASESYYTLTEDTNRNNGITSDKGLGMCDDTSQLTFPQLDFSDPKYKKFQYRVSKTGKKGSWNTIGTDNNIILSGLGHGKYKIEFSGSASDEQWSHSPAILNLKVIEPVYRHRSFIVIMFLPIIFLIYFLFEYRTKTLKKSNRVLREKEIVAREVLRQKNLLSRRNKGIEDSLKYAQRIQYAMFTSEAEIKKMFPESFILQKPKDIVSGDFYWAKKIGSKVFIAAADCTGHGVPGAFMSLIGLEFFRQIISGQGVYKPSNILDEINKNFDLIFDNEDDLEMRDGMDLAFCVIDTNTNILEYSGAFNPLYILRDGEIVEIKADKILLGPDLGYGRRPFKNNVIELQKDDIIYMFSDGYADQFGGPEGKKFKFRRFRHLLLSIYDQPLSVQHKILENSFADWQGDNEQVDDILVVGFRPVLSI